MFSRDEAFAGPHVMVVRGDLGTPVVIRLGDSAMNEPTKAGVLNRINWDLVQPASGEGLVDSNASPVLFWEPGYFSDGVVGVSTIGSQADALARISNVYQRWVNQIIGWIRRKGTKVWGAEKGAIRPDLHIQVNVVNNIYALPGALAALERGAVGTDRRGGH